MNLYARLAHLALYQPGKIAIETSRARLSYTEFDALVRRIAAGLRLAGVSPGDAVGVRLRETPEHIATMFAVMRVGAVLLPLDWRGTRKEFDRIAERFEPQAVVTEDKPSLGWHTSAVDIASLSASEPDSAAPAGLVDAPLIYSLTSGTTGEPKAMIVTHEQVLARFFNRVVAGLFNEDDRFLNTLALAYTAGREHSICALLAGATLSLFPLLFEARELVAFVNARRITTLNLSPNMSRNVIETGRGQGRRLMPDLRALISTTGKLQPEERDGIREWVAPRLIDYYGATAVGMIAVLDNEIDQRDATAVGRPVVGVEVEIADEAGSAVVPGEVGRIRIRGPAVAVPSPETADSDEGFHDGWFYPGDLGSFGPNGVLHLSGRAADLIKRGGLMVHAQEVEQALRRHASVADAAVVGAPSVDLGQEVVAFVVAKAAVEPKELTQHCRGELAPFKIPSRFVFVETLPRNTNGKVVKAELLSSL